MGGSTNVVIRGYSSITGNNQALFVIDGVPASNANNNTTAQQTFNKVITEDISFSGLLGSNLRRERSRSVRASTNVGLVVPGLYSLSNSVSPVKPPVEDEWRRGVDGVFANANFGYKEVLFLELSALSDKSTTLSESDNTYFYPAAAANFLFSNVIDMEWLSLGKVSVNYAEVGNDAPPLSIYDVYDKPTGFGSIALFSIPNTKNNQALQPERQKSFEAEFFNSLFGFDFTWYKSNTEDQIIPVTISSASGYSSRFVNAGEVENKGFEVSAFVGSIISAMLTVSLLGESMASRITSLHSLL